MSVLYTLCLTRLQCWKVGIIIPVLQREKLRLSKGSPRACTLWMESLVLAPRSPAVWPQGSELPSTSRLSLTVPYSRCILSPWMASKKAAQTIKMHGIYTEHRALF